MTGAPGVRRWTRRVALLAFLALGAAWLGASSSAYEFFAPFDREDAISAAEAERWRDEDFPLRFRLLMNGNLPDYAGLNQHEWFQIVEEALATWVAVPTATARIVLESEPVRADQGDTADRINTIGFSSDESFDDGSSGAFMRLLSRNGRNTQCDIEFSPHFFDAWPDDPEGFSLARVSLARTVAHEMGHCLGLAHSAENPIWLAADAAPGVSDPTFFPDGVPGFLPDPTMSYGPGFGSTDLTADDATGISLLYPAPGFLENRGAVQGRVVLPEGEPAPFVQITAVENDRDGAAFGPRTIADATGQFLLEGLRPGTVLLWIHPLAFNDQDHHLASAAGTHDVLDSIAFARVRAGRVGVLADITVTTGRDPGS